MFKVISGYILHKSPNFHADLDLLPGLLTITVAFSTVQCGEGGGHSCVPSLVHITKFSCVYLI